MTKYFVSLLLFVSCVHTEEVHLTKQQTQKKVAEQQFLKKREAIEHLPMKQKTIIYPDITLNKKP